MVAQQTRRERAVRVVAASALLQSAQVWQRCVKERQGNGGAGAARAS